MGIWPRNQQEWDSVFAWRQDLASADPAHAFLFHLDWNSDPHLIEAARRAGLTPAMEVGEWRSLSLDLQARLRRRWFDRPAPFRSSGPFISRVSGVVAEAVSMAGGVRGASGTLLEFGAGRLRRRPAPQPGGGPSTPAVVAGDADSYFIWFFSEFGLMAIEAGVQTAMWNELLPNTLRAGLLYSARFRGKRSLTGYSMPPEALAAGSAAEADAMAAAAGFALTAPANFGRQLHLCIRHVARSFQ